MTTLALRWFPRRVLVTLAFGVSTVGCSLLAGVEWDRVSTRALGAQDGSPGSSSGSSSDVGGASCAATEVECLSAAAGVACCPRNDDPGSPSSIAAGTSNTCVVTTTGQVRCWGSNSVGQLGRGSDVQLRTTNKPLTVLRIPRGAKSITVGSAHVCAVVDSLFACWGGNSSGAFGNGGLEGAPLPIVVSLPGVPSRLGAGNETTCATIAGTGYCWGSNTAQQAGGGDTVLRLVTPQAVPGLTGADAIMAGAAHSCASTSSGLRCWGNNTSNRLGAVGATQTGTPVAVTNGGSATQLALGNAHACAVVGGGLRCWGSNIFGELGDDAISLQSNGAITPVGLSAGVTSVCAGYGHTCAVHNGGVKCWGMNDRGQSGTAATARVPTPVTDLASGVKEVACGTFHTCAVLDSGDAKCWGSNDAGQLGDGTTDASARRPRAVIWP